MASSIKWMIYVCSWVMFAYVSEYLIVLSMGFFLIGAPLIENSRAATIKEIRDIVTKKGVGEGTELNIERDRFKMGNLDTLMFMNDKLIKLESNVESLLKKIDRQFLDLNEQPSHRWQIKCSDGVVSLQKFLSRFKWNDSRFPRSHPLNKIVETFEGKLNTSEDELRRKSNAYNETKTAMTQNQQKEGNYNVKDLADVLVEPSVKNSDFMYTKYITTVVVIVPLSQVFDFEENYELLTDNVIPKSAKKLNIPDKDGLGIWKVNLFKVKLAKKIEVEDEALEVVEKKKAAGAIKRDRDLTVSQEFIEACRDKLKITAREFSFEAGLSETRQGKRKDLKVQVEKLQKDLTDICEVCFSDAFELYSHAKVLRLIIEANMRFGKDSTVFYVVDFIGGKEKYIQNELIEIFGDKQSQGLYGTKDEIDDTEDFFPFVYIPLIVI